MNLDTPAGEAMIEAGDHVWRSAVINGTYREITTSILAAALSATVECAVCGGSGERLGSLTTRRYPQAGMVKRMVACARCGGTGRRLAWKELTDE